MKAKILSASLIALCLLGWINSTFSQTDSIMHDSVYRNYIVHLPPSYTPTGSYPLVVNMHGYGSNATGEQFYAEMNPVADTANFIVVYPNGVANSWNSGQLWSYVPGIDDVTFISALIDTMVADYSINSSMVYACGMSNGGYMSYRLACELEDKIAAIASVTGVMSDSVYNSCQTDRPVPILHMHGTADPTVAYNGTTGNTAVETGIDWWVQNNNCPTPGDTTAIPDISTTDGSTVEKIYYGPCDDDTEVVLFKITGGEHTWPGVSFLIGVTNQDIEGSGEIWLFFRKHTLPTPTTVPQYEKTRKPTLSIWPNPSSDMVVLWGVDLKKSVVTIINLLGQVVIERQLPNTSGSVSLDISNLEKGVYVVKVASSQQTLTEILVKQ